MMHALTRWLAGAFITALSTLVFAQAPVEISFYYPVAVGGPITKFVDGLARRKPPLSAQPADRLGRHQELAILSGRCRGRRGVIASGSGPCLLC